MIQSKNLQLMGYGRSHLEALARHKSELAELLGVSIPCGWPNFPKALAVPATSETTNLFDPEWPGFFFIHRHKKALVGNGGFFGPPDEFGIVEIGYEIAPEYWHRGLATEAAQAMIAYAFSHDAVKP